MADSWTNRRATPAHVEHSLQLRRPIGRRSVLDVFSRLKLRPVVAGRANVRHEAAAKLRSYNLAR
jgi:hypothetical protein